MDASPQGLSGTDAVLRAGEVANAAAAAFGDWSATPPAQRSAILTRAADLIETRVADLAALAATEVGAAHDWTAFNVRLAGAILRQAATLPAAMTDQTQDNGAVRSILRRRPAGVVLGIAPWNAPVTLAARAVAAPLACGNTAVLKASELCPRTHALVADVLHDAGVPRDALGLVTHARHEAEAVVEALIGHPAVRRVNFTGSTRVGHRIAAACARHLKPSVLELSGKAPLIVLDDADLDAAAQAAAFGAFFNQGQICMSTERVIVLDAVADAFVARLTAIASSLRAGRPGTEGARLGTLISADAAARVRGLIDDALARGAVLLAGGAVDGAVMQPAVVDHVSPAMRLYHEESFGPVASVIRVTDIDEAVSVANDTDYGLAAAVFGRDEARALAVADRIESGICQINGPTVYDDPDLPFGGLKSSGWGRIGGAASIEAFTELRWIARHDPGRVPSL
ncbi:MAG: aldehyde dehydrogenase family protein [Rhodobacteraceae bacterium]|jgi:acyl-CoA reductase-like NAD-dependent aldehyde dehydrogenase|nr:aldehyde dehydrogenase family protein [Paracoccaceae bacterium]